MRIVAGELRGRRLATPAAGSAALRPTSDRVREALFSVLADVSGAAVLDLYCGTGALGIEAISRGAASAVLVDEDISLAERNVDALGIGERIRCERADALAFLGRSTEEYDLVFCDPPYRLADRLGPELDKRLPPCLREGARVVTESSTDAPLELASLPLVFERAYRATLIRVHSAGGGR